MAWNSRNDPWGRFGSKQSPKRIPEHGKEVSTKELTQVSMLDPTALDIGLEALAMAQHLMLANSTSNRQCHAATTSALFNLVMQASLNATKTLMTASCNFPLSVDTTQHTQPLSCHASDELAGKSVKSLSPHVCDPEGFALEGIEGNVEVSEIILEGRAGGSLAACGEITDKEKGNMKCACTIKEPARLDTGTDNTKLPFCSYLKVSSIEGERESPC